ncbi:MAG: TonB family protein [Bacteroidetes bacterium]|nr:TonB family protein [Bacteroidota bacterium]
MKLVIVFLLLASNFSIHAQELIHTLVQTDFEKGYVKDGKKISVWQYFNSKKEPELVINHTTGRVMFISKDTANYVIFKNGEWVNSKLDIHPIPIAGTHNFYRLITDTLKYPLKDFKNGLEGKVVITFDVDTSGFTTNYTIIKSIGGSCDSAVLAAFKAIDPMWIPARIGRDKYQAKFAMGYEFRLKKYDSPLEHEDFKIDPKKAKFLDEFVVNDPNHNKNVVFNFVENSAEFIGGIQALVKWLEKNLRYPANARRMGLEGRVTVKFIIEPDGSITNPQILKGFDRECDKEAIRVISIMPKWKPGTQSGRPVRQSYVIPIGFSLSEHFNWRN